MRHLAIATALLAAFAAPAWAQQSKNAPASCEAMVDDLGFFQTTEATTIEDTANGCRMTDFLITPASPSRYKVAELTLVAPGLLDDYAAQRLPAEVDLTLEGVLLSPETGSELTSYIIEMQGEPMTIHLAYRWDRQARTVELADFSFAAGDLGSFRFAGRFSDADIDPNALADLPHMPGTIDELTVEIDNARFAASYFAPPLVGLLPYDQDPRTLIESYKQAVASFIASLPPANVPDDAKAALTTFVDGFPKPIGDYTLQLRADPGVKFSELAMESLPAVVALLARVHIAATHSPADPR